MRGPSVLTPRCEVVVEHLVAGKSRGRSSAELGITVRTVKAHRQRAYAALRADETPAPMLRAAAVYAEARDERPSDDRAAAVARQNTHLRWLEVQILERLAAGKPPREVAGELGVATRTVHAACRDVYDRAGLGSVDVPGPAAVYRYVRGELWKRR